MTDTAIARWHRALAERDPTLLDSLLADDVVFHSPVVHTPQVGKSITTKYLTAAMHVFGNQTFRYVREVVGPNDAVLEFVVEIDGIVVNGVDMLRWNDEERLTEFKVMVRPLKGMQVIHAKMAAMLTAMAPDGGRQTALP
jgi:SnoaL-like domain